MSAEKAAGAPPAPADETQDAPLKGSQPNSPLAELQPELGADAEQATTEQHDPREKFASLPPPILPPVDVHDLDWERIAASLRPAAVRARMRATVEQLEARLDSESRAQMLFDDQRDSPSDRALRLSALSDEPLWFIGDIHGDLLALDGALALIARESEREHQPARIVLLGDL